MVGFRFDAAQFCHHNRGLDILVDSKSATNGPAVESFNSEKSFGNPVRINAAGFLILRGNFGVVFRLWCSN